jgi:hypothetical protein
MGSDKKARGALWSRTYATWDTIGLGGHTRRGIVPTEYGFVRVWRFPGRTRYEVIVAGRFHSREEAVNRTDMGAVREARRFAAEVAHV